MANKPNITYALGNRLATTLDGSITDSATTINAVDASGFKAAGGYAIIDKENEATREIVYVESVSGNVLTVATNGRGLCGTTAVAHTSGVSIKDVIVDDHINGLADAFKVRHADDGVLLENDGWILSVDTWTYASAITFTMSGDKTAKYSAGMKIKLTQTTVKYFIITKVEYGAPNTTVTIYGGTDYTLANATITGAYVSRERNPHGFPMSPTKWTISFSDTTDRQQATPSAGTWYNMGSATIAVPIGAWLIGYKCCLYTDRATSTFSDSRSTLSTANNSESDSTFSTYSSQSGASGTQQQYAHIQLELYKDVASAVSYYLNVGTPNSGIGAIGLKNIYETAQIYAVCAYL